MEDEKVVVKFNVAISETVQELILEKQISEVEIPELNEYKPEKVMLTNSGLNYNYDEESGLLVITRESVKNEDETVSSTISRSNIDEVEVTYPLEAYTTMDGSTISMDIKIKGYNYGYNNLGTNFINPYESSDEGEFTVLYTSGKGEVWSVSPYVGEHVYVSGGGSRNKISKDLPISIYNGNIYEDIQCTYPVEWEVYINQYEKINNIILEEQIVENTIKTDEFYSLGNYISMKDYIKTKSIYFYTCSNILGDDGWIQIKDAETDTQIARFTKEDWEKYTKSSPYEIKMENLKSIKVEISKPISKGTFSIFQIKEINDNLLTTNYTLEEFNKLSEIYTYLKGTLNIAEENLLINKKAHADYETSYSVQSLSTSKSRLSNQKTENISFTINTLKANNFEKEWKNGVFLLEFPKEIIALDVEEIRSSDNRVKIRDYDIYEEDGKKFIKIYTENDEESKLFYNNKC